MTYPVQSQQRNRLFLAYYMPEYPAQAITAYMPGYESIPFIVVQQKNTRYKSRIVGSSRSAQDRQIETGSTLSDLTPLQQKALLILTRNKAYETHILDDLKILADQYTPEYWIE